MHKPHHFDPSKTIFGFWLYILTDCVMFATLFATYAVLKDSTFGGPTSRELFHPPFFLAQTLVFLLSSMTCGLAMVSKKIHHRLGWFALTFVLGSVFALMQWMEFTDLIQAGNSWSRSAFLSGFFTVTGTLWLHVLVGLLWMIVLLVPVIRHGLTPVSEMRLTCFRLFWQFLNIVWVFIFTLIYLMGVIT